MKIEDKSLLYQELAWAFKDLASALKRLKKVKLDTDFEEQQIKKAIEALEELEK